MTELYLLRTLNGLAASDDDSRDALRKVKHGSLVLVEIRRPRNIHFHKKFFAMLDLVWAAAGEWPTVEHLLADVKVAIGHVEKHQLTNRKTGETFDYVTLKSIAFHNMDDIEFEKFYERALVALCDLAGGIEAEYLRAEVLQQLAAA